MSVIGWLGSSWNWLAPTTVAIVFGIISAMLQRKNNKIQKEVYELQEKEFNRENKEVQIVNEYLSVFLSREKMIDELHHMFMKAEAGDTIWGQSVTGNIYGNVKEIIPDAVIRGTKIKIIFSNMVSQPANKKKEMIRLLKKLNAGVKFRNDNTIRIQGLSTKEAIVALPTETNYSAIYIKDEAVVSVLYDWFMQRYEEAQEA